METEVYLVLVGIGVRGQDNKRESSKPLRTELCGWREGGITKYSSGDNMDFGIKKFGT